MHIEVLSPNYAKRYEAFILEQPTTLLYHSWSYQSLLLNLLKCRQQSLLALNEQGGILAALPLMAMDGPLGTVLNSLPFYGSNGGIIGKDYNARAELLFSYNKIVCAHGIAASTIIENPLSPENTDGVVYDTTDERIGQFTPLPSVMDKEAALMQLFHYKTRNMIRKAQRLGVEVVVDNEAMSFLVAVHEENMRAISALPKSKDFFDSLPRYFRRGQDYRLYMARLNGEPVAAVLVFFYNKTVEYFTPVLRKEYRDSQALSAAIFRAMCDAASLGYAWWNWGGTWRSQKGLYRFKSRWGTQDFTYRYFTTVRNPLLLNADRAELLAAYPSFFTVPFSALSS